jgi:hypothetical protein
MKIDWINVNDRMPDNEQFVFIHSENYGSCAGMFTGFVFVTVDAPGVSEIVFDATHWAPFEIEPPQPPALGVSVEDGLATGDKFGV